MLGKSDSVRMKEAMTTIQNDSETLENRLIAFDELELLVESIDNAMGMSIHVFVPLNSFEIPLHSHIFQLR
jgi:hypothetical protein